MKNTIDFERLQMLMKTLSDAKQDLKTLSMDGKFDLLLGYSYYQSDDGVRESDISFVHKEVHICISVIENKYQYALNVEIQETVARFKALYERLIAEIEEETYGLLNQAKNELE